MAPRGLAQRGPGRAVLRQAEHGLGHGRRVFRGVNRPQRVITPASSVPGAAPQTTGRPLASMPVSGRHDEVGRARALRQ